MLIGRKDGPRFEACREGVRLIGFSSWPEPAARLASDGRALKRSYAERVEEAALPQGRHQRVTEAGWDRIQRLSVGAAPRGADDGYARTRSGRWRHALSVLASVADLVGVAGGGGGGGPRRGPDPWRDPPKHGVAMFRLTTSAGTWFLDAPLDLSGFDASTAAALQELLEAYVDTPARRTELPEAWPTGTFRPGLD